MFSRSAGLILVTGPTGLLNIIEPLARQSCELMRKATQIKLPDGRLGFVPGLPILPPEPSLELWCQAVSEIIASGECDYHSPRKAFYISDNGDKFGVHPYDRRKEMASEDNYVPEWLKEVDADRWFLVPGDFEKPYPLSMVSIAVLRWLRAKLEAVSKTISTSQCPDSPTHTGPESGPRNNKSVREEYRYFNEIYLLYREKFPTEKRLRAFLKKNPGIQTFKPSKQRLMIHIADFTNAYLKEFGTQATGDDPIDDPDEIERRKAEVRRWREKPRE